MLERCQKTGLHIIFQENYGSYATALKKAKMKTLRQRRIELITKFSKEAFKNERFKGWFVEEKSEHEKITRTQKPSGLMKQIPCRTQRYQRSSLPLMTKILAWHPPLPPPVLKLPWFYPSLSKSWLLWYKSRQRTATSWAFELYHLRLYSMKYTVNIVMVIDNLESSFRKFHLKITIVCTKAKMVHFPFFFSSDRSTSV